MTKTIEAPTTTHDHTTSGVNAATFTPDEIQAILQDFEQAHTESDELRTSEINIGPVRIDKPGNFLARRRRAKELAATARTALEVADDEHSQRAAIDVAANIEGVNRRASRNLFGFALQKIVGRHGVDSHEARIAQTVYEETNKHHSPQDIALQTLVELRKTDDTGTAPLSGADTLETTPKVTPVGAVDEISTPMYPAYSQVAPNSELALTPEQKTPYEWRNQVRQSRREAQLPGTQAETATPTALRSAEKDVATAATPYDPFADSEDLPAIRRSR